MVAAREKGDVFVSEPLLLGPGVLVGPKLPWQCRGGDLGGGQLEPQADTHLALCHLGWPVGRDLLQFTVCMGCLPVCLGLSPVPSSGILYFSKLNK